MAHPETGKETMLNETELQQLVELAKKFEPANQDAVFGIVQQHLHPVFQKINDGGRSAANTDNKTRIVDLERQLGETKTKFDTATSELKALTEKTPEIATLRREYETKIQELETTYKGQLTQKDQLVLAGHRDRAVNQLVTFLRDDNKIDPDYASTVLAKRDDVLGRIRVAADGKIEVLQQGQQELTITPAANRSALQHLAEELAATTPDKWKVSGVKGRGPNPQGSGGTGSEKNRFDEIRENEKAVSESKRTQVARPGLSRLRGEPVAAE